MGGGGSSIGAAAVAPARPDGYTILLGGTQTLVNEALLKSRPLFDPMKDLDRQNAWIKDRLNAPEACKPDPSPSSGHQPALGSGAVACSCGSCFTPGQSRSACGGR